MKIQPLPLRRDNYAYALIDESNRTSIIVDPSDAPPVIDFLEQNQLKIQAIWCTHHHNDHVGGNRGLIAHFGNIPVYASDYDARLNRIPHLTNPLKESDSLHFANHIFKILEVPGHTLGAIALFCDNYLNTQTPILFTGDTLFLGGCGRRFEGTAKQYYNSLQRLAQLPDNTQIYCGHEYTLDNLAFASKIYPQLEGLITRYEKVSKQRNHRQPTIPGTLKEEKNTNPFLQTEDPKFIHALQQTGQLPKQTTDPIEVFSVLRDLRTSYSKELEKQRA